MRGMLSTARGAGVRIITIFVLRRPARVPTAQSAEGSPGRRKILFLTSILVGGRVSLLRSSYHMVFQHSGAQDFDLGGRFHYILR